MNNQMEAKQKEFRWFILRLREYIIGKFDARGRSEYWDLIRYEVASAIGYFLGEEKGEFFWEEKAPFSSEQYFEDLEYAFHWYEPISTPDRITDAYTDERAMLEANRRMLSFIWYRLTRLDTRNSENNSRKVLILENISRMISEIEVQLGTHNPDLTKITFEIDNWHW